MTPPSARPWFETAFGDLYPRLYAHRDLDEARRCLEVLARLAPLGDGLVLDLGCGQGRHLSWLAEHDHPALGLDLSGALLNRARLDAPDRPLVRADMRAIPLGDATCDAVLSLFTTFGYFGEVPAHEPVVAEIARVLKPGGHWFLDYLNGERVAAELAVAPPPREREIDGLRVRETRELRDRPRRVVKTVQIEGRSGGAAAADLCYAEEVTLFTLDELDALAAGGGLQRVAAAGGYDGTPLEPAACDRWLLVYRLPPRGKDRS